MTSQSKNYQMIIWILLHTYKQELLRPHICDSQALFVFLSSSSILNSYLLLLNWVCINLSTSKVPVDSTLGLQRTVLLVTIWYTCQRVNR